MQVPTTDELAAHCAADAELRLAVRHWTGGLRLTMGDETTGFTLTVGVISPGVPDQGDGVICLSGPVEVWAPLFEATPPPFANVAVLASLGEAGLGGLSRSGTDPLLWWQYAPAIERVGELLRAPGGEQAPIRESGAASGGHDTPVGRYVHLSLDIDGRSVDHRVYYEESAPAGDDRIPMLLQHTAGAHSLQYRHLFEMPEITDHFRLIAYDLPFHGKSIPPVGRRWWEEQYKLEGAFLRQVPTKLAAALDLDRPVFMGCSVGGLLAIDLALHHPDVYRAVVSLEGALYVAGNWDALDGFWHPQVSNNSKARSMESLCAPQSPEAYVKEVSQVYSAGWPPAFLGDLWYYLVDYDLRDRAHEIDTARCAVHILNGEYDWSGHVRGGVEAHEAIAGSTHTVMTNVGHFPMQENPVEFANYLLPILDKVRTGS